jgi:hypothetical protein
MADKTGVRGCIFDVDGVLLDSIPAYRRAWASWAIEHVVEERAIWAVAHGRRPVDIIRATAGHLNETAALRRFEILIEAGYEQVNAVAGAREILERLPRSAWAVATSGDRRLVERAFHRLRLPQPHVGVYGEDVTSGKPDPHWCGGGEGCGNDRDRRDHHARCRGASPGRSGPPLPARGRGDRLCRAPSPARSLTRDRIQRRSGTSYQNDSSSTVLTVALSGGGLSWVFTLDQVADAHRYMEANQATGKVVILWGSITGSDVDGLPGWDHR